MAYGMPDSRRIQALINVLFTVSLSVALAGCQESNDGSQDQLTAGSLAERGFGKVNVRGGPPRFIDGDDRDWHGEPAWISSESRIDRGEFIAQDYVYDDRGAKTDQMDRIDIPFGAGPNLNNPDGNVFQVSPAGGVRKVSGDYVYPDDVERFGNNAADLIELRVTMDRDHLYFLVRVGYMTAQDANVVAIGLDTDGQQETGSSVFPANASFQGDFGVDLVLTAGGGRLFLDDFRGESTLSKELDSSHVAVNPSQNLIEFSVPRALVDPGNEAWHAYVISGLWDGETEAWRNVPDEEGGLPGSTNVYDLMFVDEPLVSDWEERGQANLLAGAGSVSITPEIEPTPMAAESFTTLDFSLIGRPGISTPHPEVTGLVTRLVRIDEDSPAFLEPGEGIELGGLPERMLPDNRYLGRYVPYLVGIPETYGKETEEDWPVNVVLHSTGGNHMQTAYYSAAFTQPGYTPIEDRPPTREEAEALFNESGRLFFAPLQRGEARTRFRAADEEFEVVYRDFISRYRVNHDRVRITGTSLGAFGAYKIALTSPERFSAVWDWIGFTTDLQVPDGIQNADAADFDLLEISQNAASVPLFFTHGALDPRRSVEISRRLADRLEAQKQEFLYFEYGNRQHEGMLAIDTMPFYQAFSPDQRELDPPRVSFTVDPAMHDNEFFPARDQGAYWLGRIQATDPSAPSRVEAESLALADRLPTVRTHINGRYVIGGNDVQVRGILERNAEEIATTIETLPWNTVSQTLEEETLQPVLPANAFEVQFDNVSGLELELLPMSLDIDDGVQVQLHNRYFEGATSITLRLSADWKESDQVSVDVESGAMIEQIQINDGVFVLKLSLFDEEARFRFRRI